MKTIHLPFLVCILLLGACGAPSPATVASATPFVADTEMALATPTPWVGGTQTARAVASQNALPASPSPISPPAVMEKPTDFSPVLYGGKLYDTTFFLLLGGVSNNAWLAPDESVERFAGEVTYSLHSMMQESKYFLWGTAPEFSPICQTYSVSSDADPDEAGLVAVLDGWDVTKRAVTELSEDGGFYRLVVTDWLAGEGISSPQFGKLQIYRVDIEGDGTDEVFISATHLDESQHTTKTGDYSIILMRKIVGNDVVTRLVIGDVYHSQDLELTYPRTYTLENFIDLDQDGTLEVVVEIRGWEKFGAAVFQIDGHSVIQTLRAEC
jgi:hypothetical protein